MGTRSSRRALAALAVALVCVGGVVGQARAHADYVRSSPGAGAVVAAAPARVEIWFSQDMFRRQGENTISVTGPDGAAVQTGEAVINDDDRRHLWVDLQPGLPAGEYAVAWRTLSAEDGDDHEGQFSFTLDPQAQTTSTPMSAATPTAAGPAPATAEPASTASPTDSAPGCGAAVAPVVGLLMLGLGARRRRDT